MMNGGDDRHFVIAPACNIDMRGLSRGGMSSLRRDEQRCGQDCSVLQRYAYLILIPFDLGGASGDMERERFCFARCRRQGQAQLERKSTRLTPTHECAPPMPSSPRKPQ